MHYTCLNTVFSMSDIEAQKSKVIKTVEYYLNSQPDLTPSRFAHKKTKWKAITKAAFIYYTTTNPNYTNPVSKNIDNEYYGTK